MKMQKKIRISNADRKREREEERDVCMNCNFHSIYTFRMAADATSSAKKNIQQKQQQKERRSPMFCAFLLLNLFIQHPLLFRFYSTAVRSILFCI